MAIYRILIKTEDQRGLIYKVSKLFSDMNLNIIGNNEFVDHSSNLFFMRSEVLGESLDTVDLQKNLESILPGNSEISIIDSSKRKRIVILVTKEIHCLGDILMRHVEDELNADIVEVIGNYDLLNETVNKFGIKFSTISHENLTREEHAQKIIEHLNKISNFDYIVLAKYMRVLPSLFVEKYKHKIINIHHSFLPAFIGANPYKQAYERGVKIIGATAHFVTNDLDEGPIIEQGITHIDHSYNWKDMQRAGRDVEKIVLSKALKLLLEDRIFIHTNKTVIL